MATDAESVATSPRSPAADVETVISLDQSNDGLAVVSVEAGSQDLPRRSRRADRGPCRRNQRRGGRIRPHIGYVVPQRRGIGYGTTILRRTLPRAKPLGIQRALLTRRNDNLPSRRVITTCGGDLDTITDYGICQYWLPI